MPPTGQVKRRTPDTSDDPRAEQGKQPARKLHISEDEQGTINLSKLLDASEGESLKPGSIFGFVERDLAMVAAKDGSSYHVGTVQGNEIVVKPRPLNRSGVDSMLDKINATRAISNKRAMSRLRMLDPAKVFGPNKMRLYINVAISEQIESPLTIKDKDEEEDDDSGKVGEKREGQGEDEEDREGRPTKVVVGEKEPEQSATPQIPDAPSTPAEPDAPSAPDGPGGPGSGEAADKPEEKTVTEKEVTEKEQEVLTELIETPSEPLADKPAEDKTATAPSAALPIADSENIEKNRISTHIEELHLTRSKMLREGELEKVGTVNEMIKVQETELKRMNDKEIERLSGKGQEEIQHAAEQDAAAMIKEAEEEAKQHIEKIEENKKNQESVENTLSAGELGGGAAVADAETGAAEDTVHLAHVGDIDMLTSTKPLVESADRIVHPEDALAGQLNKDGTVDLGIEQSGGDVSMLEGEHAEHQSSTTSANAQASSDAIMAEKSKAEVEQEQKEKKRAEQEHQDELIKQLFPTIPTDGDTDTKMGELSTHRQISIGEVNAVIDRMKQLTAGTELGDALLGSKSNVLFTLVEDKLRRLFKNTNPLRMDAPSLSEQTNALADEVIQGLIGQGSIGHIPIFAPQKSFEAIADLQQDQVGSLLLLDRETILEQLAPWWNEFRTLRTNRAVHEMERMPSRAITSVNGSIQHASKVREDIDQNTEAFGYFMFWVLRDKLQPLSPGLTWKNFFDYTSALGYNDLTQAQINWFITGNPDGDIGGVGDTDLGVDIQFHPSMMNEKVRVSDLKIIDTVHLKIADAALVGIPDSTTPFPGKDISPSAESAGVRREYRIVDGHLRAVVASTGTVEQQARADIEGVPNRVTNIPDPRFSKRGGRNVPNVRIITVRNPAFDPKLKEGDKGYQPEFVTKEVPDIGQGSKEIEGEISKANADRLLESQPLNLYAPIHPQACDRYLGKKNYQRLGTSIEQYMKHYSQHPWGPDDVVSMHNWNQSIMMLFGPTLYAFVTDAAMQRRVPVFSMATPDSVKDEYMELNELATELKRYQAASDDRADRVGDSGIGQQPLEKHLDNFFKDQEDEQQTKLADMNAVIISLPDAIPGSGGDTPPSGPGDNPPPAPPDDPSSGPGAPVAPAGPTGPADMGPGGNASGPGVFGMGEGRPPVTFGAQELNGGIRRMTPASSYTGPYGRDASHRDPEPEISQENQRRISIFRKLNRR